MKKIWNWNVALLIMVVSSMLSFSKADAAANKNWTTIYADEIWSDYNSSNNEGCQVKYGKYQLKRLGNKLFIQGDGIDTSITVKTSVNAYGGVLTDGSRIIYQNKKDIYLWTHNSNKKIFSVKKKDVLIGRYGNIFYFGRETSEYGEYQLYRYNVKTHKAKKTNYYNAYYSAGKYMLIKGQFHEGCSTELVLYNLKTEKTTSVDKHASYASAGIVCGNYIYYSTMNDSKLKWKIIRYNIKTGHKKVLKTGLKCKPIILDAHHYCWIKYVNDSCIIREENM